MTRPKRLYLNSKGKYYYIIDGKKKYIKVPPTMSQKQVQNINIKNIIGSTTARRLKKRKKKVEPRYQQRIVPNMVETTQSGLPSYIFRPGKSFTSLGDLTTKADDNTEKKLIDIFLKGATQVKSESGKIGTPKIESALKKGEKINTEYEKAMEFIKQNKVKSEPVSTPTGKNLMSEFNKSALPTPLSNIGQRGYTPAPKSVSTVPPSTSTEYATKLKKLREEQKQRKEKEKEKVPPSTADIKKLPVQERRDVAIEKVKFYDRKAKRLAQVLINEGYITSAEIPTDLPEWNAFGRYTGLTDGRDYAKFDNVIDAISDNFPEMRGSGEFEDDGLYNDQIEQIMKKRINNFVPVVAKDQVDSLLGYVKKGDKFFSAVVNTDPISGGGRHWRCIVMDNRDDFPSAEYFDPLCETMKPEESLLNVMREIAKKMNPEKYFKYKFSEIRRQSFNKSNCGYHVCKYIEDRYNGIKFSEASGYDDYQKRMKGKGAPDNSADGEKELKNYEKMIKKKFSEFL